MECPVLDTARIVRDRSIAGEYGRRHGHDQREQTTFAKIDAVPDALSPDPFGTAMGGPPPRVKA